MSIVFDEIVTEVGDSRPREATSPARPERAGAADRTIPRVPLQQALAHIQNRQLRLMAD